MAEDLCIEIVRLERGVVDSKRLALGEKEHVVVNLFVSPIQPEEHRPVDIISIVNELLHKCKLRA